MPLRIEPVDIVQIVSQHVELQHQGGRIVGRCPFHEGNDALSLSFHVLPEKHMYHCYQCRRGGDMFQFLMTLKGISFGDAVREVCGVRSKQQG